MSEHPFQPGAEVAIQVQHGWREPHSFRRGRVAKVHKNGNFVLEGLAQQQWRPYAPSSYEKFWRAGATGSGGGVLWIVDDTTRDRISEQNKKASRCQRYHKIRRLIDAEPFSDLITDDVLGRLEAAVAMIKPRKSEAA